MFHSLAGARQEFANAIFYESFAHFKLEANMAKVYKFYLFQHSFYHYSHIIFTFCYNFLLFIFMNAESVQRIFIPNKSARLSPTKATNWIEEIDWA